MDLQSVDFPILPVFLDGLLGQEDEIEDVGKGKLEDNPGDVSSGATDVPRDDEPVPEPQSPESWIERKEEDFERDVRLN